MSAFPWPPKLGDRFELEEDFKINYLHSLPHHQGKLLTFVGMSPTFPEYARYVFDGCNCRANLQVSCEGWNHRASMYMLRKLPPKDRYDPLERFRNLFQ